MEGNLKGAFALTCVAIWNGCFNSIQSVCRERPIIKREHRSGMHISSYAVSYTHLDVYKRQELSALESQCALLLGQFATARETMVAESLRLTAQPGVF